MQTFAPLRHFLTSLLLMPLAVAAQSVPLAVPEFSDYVARQLRREAGQTPVEIRGPLLLSAGRLPINLEQLHAFCRGNDAGCAAEIDAFAKGAAQLLKDRNPPPDRNAVRLVVRSADQIRRVASVEGGDALILQTRPLVDGLVAIAVLDTPRAVRPLKADDLAKLDLASGDALLELAAANMDKMLEPPAFKPVAGGQTGSIVGLFEAGRIGQLGQWASLAKAQHGVLIVALPTTDLVLRAAAREAGGKAPNPLAPDLLLRWTPERWERLP